MTSEELKKYRCDMRNDFLTEMYEFSKDYDNMLYFLDIQDEERLVEIVKNKIFEFAEVFDIIDYNYFYQTEVGNAIISMFSDVLEQEGDELYYIEAKINSSFILNGLYFLKKRLISSKWLLKYRELCCYYKNISLDVVMDSVVERFNRNIELEEDNSEVKLLLIDDFSREVEFLINGGNIDKKYNSCLVKKIG